MLLNLGAVKILPSIFKIPTQQRLQKEIRSLQKEVKAMSDQGEDLLTSTGSDNRNYVERCLESLHTRVSILEQTAKSQAEDLRHADRQWKLYRDQVTELQQRLANTQKLVLAPSSTQSLDLLMSNNHVILKYFFFYNSLWK